MTSSVQVAPPPTAEAVGHSSQAPARGAVLWWEWRLIRRGVLLMWLSVAAYMTVEVLSYRTAYPDAASRAKLVQLSEATAVRMMQGIPHAVDTAGGFAVWDGGWMLALIVACWAVLTATRITRGEEDTGRAELVLSRPVTRPQAVRGAYVALGLAAVGIGVAAALPFILLGEPVAGAALWGGGLAGFAVVLATFGVLCAQVVEPRRRAVSVALGGVAVGFLVRIVANSADDRAWLLGLSPFGWLDQLHVFADNRWLRLLPPVTAAAVLGVAALAAAGRRDTGAALLRARDTRRSRLRLLRGPLGFGWRLTSGALLAWLLTLAISSFVFGLMTGAVVDFIAKDETYRKMLEAMGMDMTTPVVGFLSYMGLFMALPFAAFAAWRIGAVRQEEADGRLENLLVRGVVRWRWLAATASLALGAALLVITASGGALWLGAHVADAPVTARQVAEPMVGTIPLVMVFIGLSVLVLALAPRLTVALPVALAVLTYLLDTFGAMLHWPSALLSLSPYHHLARLPTHPMTAGAAGALAALGVCAAGVGVAIFCRRDVQGA